MCRTINHICSSIFCAVQMTVRLFMTIFLMFENIVRMVLQTFYNFVSFFLQMLTLIPICCVFLVTSRLKCFMCGGGGPCPVKRGGACDCIMSLLAVVILFFIFRATGLLDKIFYRVGYVKATPKIVRFSPTPGELTECSRNDTDTAYVFYKVEESTLEVPDYYESENQDEYEDTSKSTDGGMWYWTGGRWIIATGTPRAGSTDVETWFWTWIPATESKSTRSKRTKSKRTRSTPVDIWNPWWEYPSTRRRTRSTSTQSTIDFYRPWHPYWWKFTSPHTTTEWPWWEYPPWARSTTTEWPWWQHYPYTPPRTTTEWPWWRYYPYTPPRTTTEWPWWRYYPYTPPHTTTEWTGWRIYPYTPPRTTTEWPWWRYYPYTPPHTTTEWTGWRIYPYTPPRTTTEWPWWRYNYPFTPPH